MLINDITKFVGIFPTVGKITAKLLDHKTLGHFFAFETTQRQFHATSLPKSATSKLHIADFFMRLPFLSLMPQERPIHYI